MQKIVSIIFLLISLSSFAQETKRGTIRVKKVKKDVDVNKGEIAYTVARQDPMFKGGPLEMNKFIAKNLKYPEAEKNAKIEGTVYVGFVVGVDGSITSSRISQGVQDGSGLDKEALRIVSIMPKWEPGVYGREKLPMRYVLPIKFQL